MAFQTLIDVDTLRPLLGTENLRIVDCRFDLMDPEAGRRAYAAGHLPTARYAHLNRDLSSPVTLSSGRHPLPEATAFAATLRRLRIGEGTRIVAYDDANAAFAARLWWLLRWVGLQSVAVLDGGFQAWIAGGGAVAVGADENSGPAAAPLSLRLHAAALVSTAEVANLAQDSSQLLVDARAVERFAGRVEPIDSVAGHIPGAVNHPFSANLGSDGRFLAADELRRRWMQRLAGTPSQNVVAMCGSGVTACHNLLSLEVAGLRGAKLYAGSWSEWIRDPQRPIARS